MYSELFHGEIVYTKRFPVPDVVDDFLENETRGDDARETDREAHAESGASADFMQSADENCVYVLRSDKLEFCERFIDYAKKYSEQFGVGIDVIRQRFSYLVRLYIDLAHFRGRYKEMMQYMMFAADEFYFDPPGENPCNYVISFVVATHDLFYDGKPRVLN